MTQIFSGTNGRGPVTPPRDSLASHAAFDAVAVARAGNVKRISDTRTTVSDLLEIHDDFDASSRTRGKAFEDILALGKNEDPEIRRAVIDELVEAVKHRNPIAATLLGHLKDPRALPSLIEAAYDKSSYVMQCRQRALIALGAMVYDSAIPALMEAFSDYAVQGSAKEGIVLMGASAVPALVRKLAGSRNDKLRAVEILKDMGAQAQSALPDLEKRTQRWREWDGKVREAARSAIDTITVAVKTQ